MKREPGRRIRGEEIKCEINALNYEELPPQLQLIAIKILGRVSTSATQLGLVCGSFPWVLTVTSLWLGQS